MDPISIGTLAATALATGASEAGKAVLGKAATDAYDGLKSLVARWAAPDVAAIEVQAGEGAVTKARQAVLAEVIDARPQPDRAEARALAEVLTAALIAEGCGVALGATLNQFNACDNSRQYNAPGGTQIFNAPTGPAVDES